MSAILGYFGCNKKVSFFFGTDEYFIEIKIDIPYCRKQIISQKNCIVIVNQLSIFVGVACTTYVVYKPIKTGQSNQ